MAAASESELEHQVRLIQDGMMQMGDLSHIDGSSEADLDSSNLRSIKGWAAMLLKAIIRADSGTCTFHRQVATAVESLESEIASLAERHSIGPRK